jgi:hypothetical protein
MQDEGRKRGLLGVISFALLAVLGGRCGCLIEDRHSRFRERQDFVGDRNPREYVFVFWRFRNVIDTLNRL